MMLSWHAQNTLRLRLPDEFAAQLRALHPPTGPGHRPTRVPPQLRAALAATRRAGWTLETIGNALGLSRERIRQIVAGARPDDVCTITIPSPPPPPLTKQKLARAARKPKPRLTEQEKAELAALIGQGRANGVSSPDHPAVLAGMKLAKLINDHMDRGVSVSDIAQACGVTDAAIYLRLGRYGYRPVPPSQRKNSSSSGPIAVAMAAARAEALEATCEGCIQRAQCAVNGCAKEAFHDAAVDSGVIADAVAAKITDDLRREGFLPDHYSAEYDKTPLRAAEGTDR